MLYTCVLLVGLLAGLLTGFVAGLLAVYLSGLLTWVTEPSQLSHPRVVWWLVAVHCVCSWLQWSCWLCVWARRLAGDARRLGSSRGDAVCAVAWAVRGCRWHGGGGEVCGEWVPGCMGARPSGSSQRGGVFVGVSPGAACTWSFASLCGRACHGSVRVSRAPGGECCRRRLPFFPCTGKVGLFSLWGPVKPDHNPHVGVVGVGKGLKIPQNSGG